jgi:hypothetical protein
LLLYFVRFFMNEPNEIIHQQDIIENEDIKLDIMFISSLIHDLIKVS